MSLPESLANIDAVREVRLVWDRAAEHYAWHIVVEDGRQPKPPHGARVMGVDFGEVHPAACTDGEEVAVITARELRAVRRYTHKRLGALQHAQAGKAKGSRRWRRIERRKRHFLLISRFDAPGKGKDSTGLVESCL